MNRICVLGLGYIGLPTSLIFADNGWEVTGVDVNANVIETLRNGEVHIKEPGISKMLETVTFNKNTFTASYEPMISDVYIITVPTPLINNSADLSYVKQATKTIVPFLKKGNIVIIESTIPPRTTRDVVLPILEESGLKGGIDFYLAHCPERVLPGSILQELVENNRIVGGINDISAKKAAEVYNTFVTGEVLETVAESAEMSKLMENTYRDVNIALANELQKITNNLGIDALEIIKLANYHPRVNIHSPGPGVGGHCLAIDPYFIIEKDLVNTELISQARGINESMPSYLVELLSTDIGNDSKIAVFGLAYKGNVDDIRNSPSIEIVNELIKAGFSVKVHDPYIDQTKIDIPLTNREETVKDADVLLVLTDHDCFQDLKWIKSKNIVIIDTKNCVKETNGLLYDFGSLHKLRRSLTKI